MQEFFLKLIASYREIMIIQYHLPIDAKVIVHLDCWLVHDSKNINTLYRAINWLIIIFVPGGCTPIFPCDVGLQWLFKHYVHLAASDNFVSHVQQVLQLVLVHQNYALI
jgi:hypothetical protein